MEYHSFLLFLLFYFILIVLFCQWVSVSLQSIIHSYFTPNIIVKDKEKILSFRLLMEYHSFLFCMSNLEQQRLHLIVSISLRSYIHSYIDEEYCDVPFIRKMSFHLLTELYSFLL